MSKAVLLISHGSRLAKTKQEILELIKVLKSRTGIAIIEPAFLEIEAPSIPDGIDLCVSQGASEIIVLLNFLNSGRHVNDDIPCIVNEAKQRHPKIVFTISSPVGQHVKIADLFVDLIYHA